MLVYVCTWCMMHDALKSISEARWVWSTRRNVGICFVIFRANAHESYATQKLKLSNRYILYIYFRRRSAAVPRLARALAARRPPSRPVPRSSLTWAASTWTCRPRRCGRGSDPRKRGTRGRTTGWTSERSLKSSTRYRLEWGEKVRCREWIDRTKKKN